jgi:hypothetical protein
VALPVVQRFFAPPRARELDTALFSAGSADTAEAEGATAFPAAPAESTSPDPTLLKNPAQPKTAAPEDSTIESLVEVFHGEAIYTLSAESVAPANESHSGLRNDPRQTVGASPPSNIAEKRKTPQQVILKYKVLNKIRTHEQVADKLGLERSVYFELKAGRRVSEETYVKAALVIGCRVDDLKP